MKKRLKRLCCAILSTTTIASMLTILPANAVNIKQDFAKQVNINYEQKEIPEGMGATGDLSLGKGLPEDAKIIKSSEDYYNEIKTDNSPVIEKVNRKKNSVLPSSVDNSQSKYFPPIGNQGSIGSCVCFAQVYYQFTYTYNKTMDIETTAENTFSPKFVFNCCGDDERGSDPDKTYKFMKNQGNVPLSILPYDEDTLSISPTEEVWGNSIKHRITDYQFFEELGKEDTQITSPDDPDLLPVKTALSNGEILGFSTYAHSFNFEQIKPHPSIPENNKYAYEDVITYLSDEIGGHRMCIVGYNDDIWCDINKDGIIDRGEMGAFKVVNSWGLGFANGGYAWVAYDALNQNSCVTGLEYLQKFRVFEEIARIEVDPTQYNGDIYLKYTLNTPLREQAKVFVYAERNGSEITCEATPDAIYGYSFDGSYQANDGTLAFPLDRVAPQINSENIDEYTFRVEFKDTNADSIPTIVKDATIVDKNTGKTYTVENVFPFTLDGNSKTVEIQHTSVNNIVVYYVGYDNPVVHIKDDDEWFSVSMTSNMERRGATHKYVFETDNAKDIQLYFTDGDNTDDNNGEYFTATNGLNFFKTKNVRQPITATYSTTCDNVLDIDEHFLFTFEAEGGYAPYTYEIIDKNIDTGEEIIFEYGHDLDGSYHSSSEEGNFVSVINVKDYANDIYTMYFYYEVKDLPFIFKEFSVEPDGTSVTGRELNFTAVSKAEYVMDWGPVKSIYDIVIKRGDEVCYETSELNDDCDGLLRKSTTHFNWTPTQAGIYTVTISSQDGNEEYAEKSLTFEIKDDRIGDVNGDGDIDVTDVTAIQMYLAKTNNADKFRTVQSDCDKNREVNIDDATYIQMYIAQHFGGSSVGEILIYHNEPITTTPSTEPETEPSTQPTTAPINNMVTFTNSFNWSGTISCYYWSDSNKSMTTWPGVPMTYSGTNDYGEMMYTFEVPQDATYVIFTNGSAQTTDIPYKGGEVRYYPLSSTDSRGHNLVNTW